MTEFMKTLLSLSFSGTILFLLVFTLIRLFKTGLSRRWQYYIWLPVALRFLIPFAPGENVTNALFHSAEMSWQDRVAVSAVSSEAAGGGSIGSDAGTGLFTDGARKTEDAPLPIRHLNDPSTEVSTSRRPNVAGCLFILWAGGALFWFIRKIIAYRRYMRYLAKENTEVAEAELLNVLEESKERLHIRKNIKLYRNPSLFSPIMTGFLTPCIVLPETALAEKEAVYIFMHELVHYKYRDMFYKWLVQITICLHWFNPAVHFLGKRVNENCELACDEKVIEELDKQERKAYGDALLSFMKTEKHYENPTASLTLSEEAEQLIERLGAIMDYKKKTKTGILFAGILTAAVCFCFTVLGAYAGRDGKEHLSGEKLKAEKETVTEDYLIISEENVYYILVGDADPDDIPVGVVTKGSIGITLVRESGYTSLGPFPKTDFLYEVETECERCLEKAYLSEEEEYVILEAAERIEDSGFGAFNEEFYEQVKEYNAVSASTQEDDMKMKVSYCQRALYQEPYIIELGWNLSEKIKEDMESCPNESVTMPDGREVTVYFREELGDYMTDEDMLVTVAKAIDSAERKVEEESGSFELPTVKAAYVVNLLYVPREEIDDFAKAAWENNDVGQFCYIVDELTDEVKKGYCEKAYNENRTDFFAVTYDTLSQEEIDNFGRRCYEEDNVDYFAILCDELSGKAKSELREKAEQEGKEVYYFLLDDTDDK